tara:strand:- start:448 stop:678 length:231 start_codon:yes stop_codon:yes gene_type:complete
MNRKTKKTMLEFLHFWPMTIVVPLLLILILTGCNTVPKTLEGTNNTVKKEETKLEALDKFWRLLRPVRILTTGISK